ncbi:hypothetical protein IEQ34_014302 [Dendrobium chrysotoxum]|uniref:Uncharacterized protein n=1 Tax=Dendrobium chrysotoxum TaxID=161865 RepID=A0AAV7GKV4_DENCH|nr:hypothetical protein IEQ34_014302 [Dendrobium chrysotoxum]
MISGQGRRTGDGLLRAAGLRVLKRLDSSSLVAQRHEPKKLKYDEKNNKTFSITTLEETPLLRYIQHGRSATFRHYNVFEQLTEQVLLIVVYLHVISRMDKASLNMIALGSQVSLAKNLVAVTLSLRYPLCCSISFFLANFLPPQANFLCSELLSVFLEPNAGPPLFPLSHLASNIVSPSSSVSPSLFAVFVSDIALQYRLIRFSSSSICAAIGWV